MLKKLEEIIMSEYSNTAGIAIYKENRLIYEKYFNGFSKDDALHLTSVTKSITSLLIGIAIDKGLIKSVDDNVLDYFPDYVLKRGEKTIQSVTIKHIMTMTAPYKFKSEPYSKVYGSDDWTKATLDLLGGRGPIGDFKYTSVGVHILSGLIEAVSGMSIKEFAEKNLFEPLSIETPKDYLIEDKAAYMSFVKYKGKNAWIVDPSGNHTTGWGLALSLSDIAKLGLMVLNRGIFNDLKILSSEWIENSLKIESHWNQLAYGLMWWVIDDKSFAAIGDGGNLIYINRAKNVVIVTTATFKPRYEDRIGLINKYILPNI